VQSGWMGEMSIRTAAVGVGRDLICLHSAFFIALRAAGLNDLAPISRNGRDRCR
jgi:hypothetical protein